MRFSLSFLHTLRVILTNLREDWGTPELFSEPRLKKSQPSHCLLREWDGLFVNRSVELLPSQPRGQSYSLGSVILVNLGFLRYSLRDGRVGFAIDCAYTVI